MGSCLGPRSRLVLVLDRRQALGPISRGKDRVLSQCLGSLLGLGSGIKSRIQDQ